MFLKVVEGQGPGFRLIEVAQVAFGRVDGSTFADVTMKNGIAERVAFRGTAYVLNSQGDTIEKFSDEAGRKGQ